MTPTELYDGCTVGDLLRRAVERGGDRTAFVDHDGSAIGYRALGARLSGVAQALEARGLGRGDAIATLSDNRVDAWIASSAANLIGLRATAMHPLGSEDDHDGILEDAGIGTLVFDPTAHGERAARLAARRPGLRLLSLGPSPIAADLLADAASRAPMPLVSRARADDVCNLTYTGGTSGRPKGVMSTHRVRATMVMSELAEWDWPAEPRFLAITPITHAAGAIVLPVLLRSGTVIVARGFEPARFAALVRAHRATMSFLVPTMLYRLLDDPGLDTDALATLETVIYGASPIAPARLAEAVRRLGPRFMQLYGQTESPNCITVLRRSDHDPDRHPERLASCGVPIGPIRVALLDEAGHEVPDGEVGEICVRGPLVMAGYWNRPEETAQAFRHGWLHTGDLARRDADGFLYIVDRSKDMIVSGGFNVFPREVEDVLTAHPAVAAAGVIGVPDATWGEAVKAVVVLRPGASASAAELIALVRERKGPVQAPKTVDFVEALPLTGLGKPDKKALRARYWAGSDRGVA
ncbi:MAG: AMP-binding protein [Burkholderiales bacterium]|jgi:fatty-acyl-CoA synthase